MTETLRDALGCTCLRLRRATRRLTQIYDGALEPSELTVNQFGLLASLHDPATGQAQNLSIGGLALRLGADPTTLNRSLKPILAKGLIRDESDPKDARVRLVRITPEGERVLAAALPLWGQAQRQVKAALGPAATSALNALLDVSIAQLADSG